MRDTAVEVQQGCTVSMALVGPLVLATAALACQGLIDVIRPNCAPSPCSLNTVIIAGSGERKTTVINKLLRAVYDFENKMAARVAASFPAYEAESVAWEVRKKAILSQIARCEKKDIHVGDLNTRLTQHFVARPIEPKHPKIVYEDPTPEAIGEGICSGWHSVAVVSSEGGGFFNGRAMHDLPMWNKIWDGAGIVVERVGRGVRAERNARGSLILALQEGQFSEFIEARGARAMDIGFLARILVSSPPKMSGQRMQQPDTPEFVWTALTKFHSRVTELLECHFENQIKGENTRKSLRFDPSAQRYLIEKNNEIEQLLKPGGYLSSLSGYAAKINDNAARIAAIFHLFEGAEGEIRYDTLVRAFEIAEWHADQFVSLFGPEAQAPTEQRNAKAVEKWLFDKVWCVGNTIIPKTFVRQAGPSSIRCINELNNALEILLMESKIRILIGNRNMKYIELNGDFFSTLSSRLN